LGNLIPFIPPLAVGKVELEKIVDVQVRIINFIRKGLTNS
jgi:hypothetical protein